MSRILTIAAILIASGCSLDDAAELTAGIPAQCSSDVDCDEGTTCAVELRLCRVADPGLTIAIVPTPPAQSGLVAPREPKVVDLEDGEVSLPLPEVAVLRGRVQTNLLKSSLEAVITATAVQDTVPSHVVVQQATTDADGFELPLQAGVEYELAVTATSGAIPVWRTKVTIHEDSDFEMKVPAPEEHPLIDGRVRRKNAGATEPISDVAVTALNVDTQEQCTTSVTDQLGHYAIRCPIGTGNYRVLVSPTEAGPLVPSFTAIVNDKDKPSLFEGDRTMPDIVLEAEPVEATVRVRVSGPDGAVPGVPVTASATLAAKLGPWSKAIVRSSGVTDETGVVELQVLECDDCVYDVVATPHPTVPLSAAEHPGWEVRAQPDLDVTLLARVSLIGTVLDHSGAAVANARVEARRTAVDAATNTTTELQYTTETLADGTFELKVDVGDYCILAQPPMETGLPRKVETISVPDGGRSLPISLDRPAVLQGVVTGPDSAPVADVTVDVYAMSEHEEPVLLGTGISTDSGRYLVILPAP